MPDKLSTSRSREISPVITEGSPLTLREALVTINEAMASPGRTKFNVLLVCGFNPLHLQTFLHAHLKLRLAARSVELRVGLYDDFFGTLRLLRDSTADACAIVLEWSDLDARLGFRRLGGWNPRDLPEIVAGVEAKLLQMRLCLEGVSPKVAICGPSLPFPPLFYTRAEQSSSEEVRLHAAVQQFLQWAVDQHQLRVVNPQHFSVISPPGARYDFKADLLTGCPYSVSHAERVASVVSSLLVPIAPKKGLITDLDDTLWSGLVGEVGGGAISWDLASGTQVHGLYQQLLCALAGQGVLVGVATKNNPEIIKQALDRDDLILPRESIFPVEANWNPKSESVGRILRTWNVSADNVVFVDDSPMELAEVKAAFPEIQCLLFNTKDYGELHKLLYRLRNLFAKDHITPEDELRVRSLATGQQFRTSALGRRPSYEEFMQGAQAQIVFSFARDKTSRTLELVNKTNQFNLNGIRFTELEWQNSLKANGNFALSVNYKDKYGPLGIISALKGHVDSNTLYLDVWVLSCRAFARRIEHQIIAFLFQHFDPAQVSFNFVPTTRNGVLQEFLAMCAGKKVIAPCAIDRTEFFRNCPALYHEVSLKDG
jgi:FkbH-like protein